MGVLAMKSFYLLDSDESFIIDRWRELPQDEQLRIYQILLQGLSKMGSTTANDELDKVTAAIVLDYHKHR